MNKELLKKAFDAGREYQLTINPYNGKPMREWAVSFTKWYNKQLECQSTTKPPQGKE